MSVATESGGGTRDEDVQVVVHASLDRKSGAMPCLPEYDLEVVQDAQEKEFSKMRWRLKWTGSLPKPELSWQRSRLGLGRSFRKKQAMRIARDKRQADPSPLQISSLSQALEI